MAPRSSTEKVPEGKGDGDRTCGARRVSEPFFIVGSARSGTTMLRLMMNAHPDVAVPPESRFIVELWRGREQVDTEDWLRELAGHRRFGEWGLDIDAVRARLDGVSVSYGAAVEAAFCAYAEARGKVRWGDKTPRYIENIPLLARLFPGARFVHIVRDGRNVALSYADLPFGPSTVGRAASLWARRVSAGMRAGRVLGDDRYMEIRYETLVRDREALERVARRLCRFLTLDFHEHMLDYGRHARAEVLERSDRFNPRVTEQPQADTRSWERDMPPEQVEVFEAVAGPLLEELGYPRRWARPRWRARVAGALGVAGLPVSRLTRVPRAA
jgi:hypothetical protein